MVAAKVLPQGWQRIPGCCNGWFQGWFGDPRQPPHQPLETTLNQLRMHFSTRRFRITENTLNQPLINLWLLSARRLRVTENTLNQPLINLLHRFACHKSIKWSFNWFAVISRGHAALGIKS